MTLLAGQTANIPVQMQPATLQENVTVTAEAPLVNVTQTSPSGNIDPKQFSELPAEGRNWMALLLVAPGSRTTSVNQNAPIPMRGGGGDQQFFQTNVDGQQVSNELGGGTAAAHEPGDDLGAAVHLEPVRRHAGRSLGVQVNVITKSGTNKFAGSVRGNFRDSKIGYAKDPLASKVVPFKDQQFATLTWRTDHQGQAALLRLPGLRPQPEHGRVDDPVSKVQRVEGRVCSPPSRAASGSTTRSSSQTRFMAKGDLWRNWDDGLTGGSAYPSSAATTRETGNTLNFQLTRVLNNRIGERVEGGLQRLSVPQHLLDQVEQLLVQDHGPYGPVQECGPVITFTGFSFGGNQGYPRHRGRIVTGCVTTSLSCDARGQHDLRTGGEFIYHTEMSANCTRCRSTIHGDRPTGRAPDGSDASAVSGLVPGSVQRGHVELQRDQPVGDQLQHRHPQGTPHARPSEPRRVVGAGRLAAVGEVDAQPRPALGHSDQRVRQRRRGRAVHGSGAAEPEEQLRTADGCRVRVERQDGHPCGRRSLLRRKHHVAGTLRARVPLDRAGGRAQRRARRTSA